ncbi:PepSY-associated TM helix domain-containing protein [Motilimonas pumila]|uniref:Peptidase n=1 Tax=Motilimonas pumila TaxID=2303987 RepID=A0A418YF18_9GAMM|nr:PepSY-associated TM helix domain-containing protein [Motilimonas pumila]RJG47753.1 peptidase [Motilimonas pumila]
MKRLQQKGFQTWSRRIHVYSSMCLLLAVAFFAITGITLNRASWFTGEPDITLVEHTFPRQLFDEQWQLDQPQLMAYLQQQFAVSGQASSISVLLDKVSESDIEGEVSLDFKGPGSNTSVFIELPSLHGEVETIDYGTVAWLNDLHKGRNTGPAWHWFIDLCAVIMLLFLVTGIFLLLPKKKTLRSAMLWLGFGSVVTLAFYGFV